MCAHAPHNQPTILQHLESIGSLKCIYKLYIHTYICNVCMCVRSPFSYEPCRSNGYDDHSQKSSSLFHRFHFSGRTESCRTETGHALAHTQCNRNWKCVVHVKVSDCNRFHCNFHSAIEDSRVSFIKLKEQPSNLTIHSVE